MEISSLQGTLFNVDKLELVVIYSRVKIPLKSFRTLKDSADA